MAAQLKEILKQTIPYYQQGAPLLLEAHAIYEDTATGQLIAQLKWRNISRLTVHAVNVTLHCKDSFGATLEASTYQYMDVSAAPQGIFGTQNAIPLVSERTRQCAVSITGVSFADGSIWSATGDDACEALPDGKVQTLTGDLLSQFERDVVDRGFSTAVKFIPQIYWDLWQCGCGRWQKQDDDICTSCKATMTQLSVLSEPTALTERLAAYQKKQEEKRIAKEKADAEKRAKAEVERIEHEKRKEALKKEQAIAQAKAKKSNILIAVVLTVAVAAVLVFTQVIQPKQKYEAAVALMESGQYEEASAAFAELGQYSDAAERVNEPFYLQAEELLVNGQYDEASAAFTKAGDYSNAADRIGEPNYVQAEALLANGEYDSATNAFKMAGSYSDASERIGKTRYAQAEALLADGQYDEAASAFAKAGDYSDAADRIGEPYYLQAEALLADEKYDQAVSAFAKAGDYSDAVERVKKTHYIQAEALLADGQYDEAASAFAKAGDYSDAADRIGEPYYLQAEALLANGQYDEAASAFTKAGDYSDAVERVKKTHYIQAEALLANGQYDEAIAAFTELGEYSDAATQVQESQYQKGLFMLTNGNPAGAYAILVAMKGYKDADELIKNDKDLAAITLDQKFTVGNTFTFGTYEQDNNASSGTEPIEWLVLKREDKRVLVISVFGLDCIKYNERSKNTTWDNSSLRTWLNGTFLNAAFTQAEQQAIPTVLIQTPKNPKCRTNPGNDTHDKVFCLSIQEAESLFASFDTRSKSTAYAVKQGAWTDDYGYSCWSLRSPGVTPKRSAIVYQMGIVYYEGLIVNHEGMTVRPAMWLDLTSGIL